MKRCIGKFRLSSILAALLALPGCLTVQDVDADLDGHFDEYDCDDGDSAVHPDAEEVCDGVDDDCDGEADEADAEGAPLWYLDEDGDGYGDGAPLVACDAPDDDAVEVNGDCDDGDGSVHPGVDEICDGVDNDCDGKGVRCFEGEHDTSDATYTVSGCTNGDQCGAALATADLDGDGVSELWMGAPGANGAVYGRALDGVAGEVSPSVTISDTTAGGAFGASLAVGDADADGYQDLWVGAPASKETYRYAGAVWWLEGPAPDGAMGTRLVGEASYEDLGTALAWAEDVESTYLIVGAPGVSPPSGRTSAGAVYVVADGAPGSSTVTLGSADLRWEGDASGEEVGRVLAAGDLTGDGVADLAVSGDLWSGGVAASGVVYLVDSPSTGGVLTDAPWTRRGSAGEQLGFALGVFGDLDGDGLDDLAVGAPGADAGGDCAVGAVQVLSVVDEALVAVSQLRGDAPQQGVGAALTGGDVDRDGQTDLAVSAPDPASGSSTVWLAYGPLGADETVTHAAETHGATLSGAAAGDGLGSSLRALDNLTTGAVLAAGAPGFSNPGESDNGTAYIWSINAF